MTTTSGTGTVGDGRAVPGDPVPVHRTMVAVDVEGLLPGLRTKLERVGHDAQYRAALDRAARAAMEEYDDPDALPDDFDEEFDGASDVAAAHEPTEDSHAPAATSTGSGAISKAISKARWAMHAKWRKLVRPPSAPVPAYDWHRTPRTSEAHRLWARAHSGDAASAYLYSRFLAQDGRYDRSVGWLTRAADDGHADAAAFMGHRYERIHNVEEALRWYLQAHLTGSELGTVALARIRYDTGDRDGAMHLLSQAWTTDQRLIRVVFDALDEPRWCPRARKAPDPQPAREIVVKLTAGLTTIPPVLPGTCFRGDVWARARAQICGPLYVVQCADSPNDAAPTHPRCDVDPTPLFWHEEDSQNLNWRQQNEDSEAHRLVDDVRALAKAWGVTGIHGNDQPSETSPCHAATDL